MKPSHVLAQKLIPAIFVCVLAPGLALAKPLSGEINTNTTDSSGQQLNGNANDNGSKPLKGEIGKSGAASLKGEVARTGAVLPAAKLHMTAAELKAAIQQYSDDLHQFYLHADDYHKAQEELKKQIGECTENEQQWQAKLKQDRLQINAVIIPIGVPKLPPPPTNTTVKPPRVCCVKCLITGRCGHLGTGGGSMAGGGSGAGMGASRADAMRVADASRDLARKQGNLRLAEQESGMTSQKAIDEAKINESQQNLAEKFGRLKEEFQTLKIEKEALTGIKVQ